MSSGSFVMVLAVLVSCLVVVSVAQEEDSVDLLHDHQVPEDNFVLHPPRAEPPERSEPPMGASPYTVEAVSELPYPAFLEAPAVGPDGGVYFSDRVSDTVRRYDPASKRTVIVRSSAGGVAGMVFDSQGRLYACESAGRRVVRYPAPSASSEYNLSDPEPLVAAYEGKRLNSPRALVLDEQRGSLYFTDPREGDRAEMELQLEGIFRLGLSDRKIELLLMNLHRPAALALLYNNSRLIVSDNDEGVYDDGDGHRISSPGALSRVCDEDKEPSEEDLAREDHDMQRSRPIDRMIEPRFAKERDLWAYWVENSGLLSIAKARKHVYGFNVGRGAEGLCVSRSGVMYAAAGVSHRHYASATESLLVEGGLHVVDEDRGAWDVIRLPRDLVTACAVAPPAANSSDSQETVYATAGRTLFQVRVDPNGHFADLQDHPPDLWEERQPYKVYDPYNNDGRNSDMPDFHPHRSWHDDLNNDELEWEHDAVPGSEVRHRPKTEL